MLLTNVLSQNTNAQINIQGKVVDDKNKAIGGASIFILNRIDGCSSDSTGFFSLTTNEKGELNIIATEISFDSATLKITLVKDTSNVIFHMKSIYGVLSDVMITAGSFTASDNSKTVLTPMDIMTTAGANADVTKAIETLPGTQQPGVSTGLFVRGGDASETSIVIDGMVVQNPFQSNVPGVSQSSRFSPFQFKGISFSSGGYSVRYGQALSSVLELNTQDLPDKDKISIGANVTGIFGSAVIRFKKSSLEVGGSYNNSSLFYKLATTNIDFYNPPSGSGFSIKYVFEPKANEILKAVAQYSNYNAGLKTPDPFIAGDTTNFGIKNFTFFSDISYEKKYADKWGLFLGASYSVNHDNIHWTDTALGNIPYKNNDERNQYRAEIKNNTSKNLNILGGIELQNFSYTRIFDTLHNHFSETLAAIYLEANWAPLKMLVLRPGIRYEYSRLLSQNVIEPRLSLAIKINGYSQVSMASGWFYQDPENVYLLFGYKPLMAEANHYVINYQWIKSDRTLCVEGYYKNYKSLVKESSRIYDPNSYRFIISGTKIDNSGFGYATGAEVFFHDKKTIHGLDYWVSYSYIDTKRLYENFVKEATPFFVSTHNLNVVTKYFVDAWQTSFSITYTFASGRTYYNPTNNLFLSDRTPPYQNLAIGIGRLQSIKKWFMVVYAGIDNVTNHHNFFGYRYSADGFRKYPDLPALYRSALIGINVSLSQFNKSEL